VGDSVDPTVISPLVVVVGRNVGTKFCRPLRTLQLTPFAGGGRKGGWIRAKKRPAIDMTFLMVGNQNEIVQHRIARGLTQQESARAT
jgi:hypothetical protein